MGCLTFCQHNNGNSIKKASETISVSVTQPSYLAYLAGDKCSQKIVTFVYENDDRVGCQYSIDILLSL